MLLDFKMKNFKSFYELSDFTMMAEMNKKDNYDCLMNIKDSGVSKKVLPSAVIYGGNASGKTTLIYAINLMKQIIVNGTIKNQIENKAIKKMEFDTFIHDYEKSQEPMYLEITFKAEKNIYNYLIGCLCSYNQSQRKINKEELYTISYKKDGNSINEIKEEVFIRNDNHLYINSKFTKENSLNNIEEILSQNLDMQDLFLTNGFKSMISIDIANDIVNWFQNKLVTIVDFTASRPVIKFVNGEEDTNTMMVNSSIDKLVKLADFGPQRLGYVKDDNSNSYSLYSFYNVKGTKGGVKSPANEIESKGTVKLIDFWMSFLTYFKRGGVFILDEFDSSIHPEIVSGIIDLFNNPEINVNNAQLIFNTHNPLYLQKRFFRRDQIVFIEKDKKTYMSSIYKLADFNVRSDLDYMKNYFEGKFGALPYIDFESALD